MPTQGQPNATAPAAPIVALGASAGGIEAFRDFFGAMPASNGLIFLVVLHLAPERASLLVEILGQWTEMKVVHAEDGVTPVPEHVYVIPPSAVLTLRGGRLHLSPAEEPRHANTAIDALFASLAAECGERTIGIVLSGTGSDGALGLKAIKQCGGITLAQGGNGTAPGYEGMPSAAIATGAVDLVLPVADMPARILTIARPRAAAGAQAAGEFEATEAIRPEICAILRDRVGHDFSHYKEPTFLRRVQRRMHVTGCAGAAYLARLRDDTAEPVMLFRDLLIGVTSFFRDTATFQIVEDMILPRLFQGRSARDHLRVWVPGCATGEEAYSLAIMLVEFMDRMKDPPQVQIFATDIDGPAIDIARLGRYPQLLLRDVPEGRIARFFTPADDSYVVSREIRGLCTFSAHSVIRDPPFSRMNLISCRNLLIYLDAELQSQVIPSFHYSLVAGGLLLLGASESVARHGELFTAVDRRHRIYVRNDVPSPPLQVSALNTARRLAASLPPSRADDPPARREALQFAQRRIRDRFSPAYAVVTAEGEAVYFSPRTGKYLENAAGPPSHNLLSQARQGLRLELRSALRRAAETRQAVERENISVHSEFGPQSIVLTIEPLPHRAEATADALFLVVFSDDDRLPTRTDRAPEAARPLLQDLTIEQLERELRDLREQNQSIAEEYETALEELKSANEELHSVNEELQSSNEELETSKEEIQSVNEELQTVNFQLNAKVDELDRASTDLRNLFESTRVPTIFLDRDLIIRSFTPAVAGIYNLIATDQGRKLTDIVSALAYDTLAGDVAEVLAGEEPIERRVERRDGAANFLLRMLPYRASSNEIAGVLITYIDITTMVQAERHDKLLVDELNHRVKNMLTVVISLATQTRRGAADFEAFWQAFTGRVRALAGAYELLSREQWTDIPLADVLKEEMEPHMAAERRNIAYGGPPVFLRPKGALAFGMVVHELATNAVKYGALSAPEGRIRIEWQIEGQAGDRLVWRWREHAGPAVNAPSRRGFGVALIERSLKHEMNGAASLDFQPGGLVATLTIPFDSQVIAGTSSRRASPP